MLRTLFVSALLVVGWGFALKGPFEALLLYLWIAYFRPELWVWTDLFRELSLSYFAGIYLVGRSLFSAQSFKFDLRSWLLLAIFVQSGLSAFFSDFSEYSLGYWYDFAKSTIVTYLIAVLATDVRRIRLVILVMCLSLAFEGARQGWFHLLLNPTEPNSNQNPFLGDNNGTAVGMLMLVPMFLALARTSGGRLETWFHRFLLVGVLFRGLSTYSRGAFVAAGALAAAVVLRSPRVFRAAVGAILIGALTLSVLPDTFWDRMSTIVVDDGEEREASSANRLHFWAVALRMAQANPLLGVGHNAYNEAYDQYDFSGGRYGQGRSVHSLWFGLMAELGILGTMLVGFILLLAFWTCRRTRRLARQGLVNPDLQHFAVAVEGALVVASVGGAFVIFQYTEILWHAIGLSMALHNLTVRELAGETATQPAGQGPRPVVTTVPVAVRVVRP